MKTRKCLFVIALLVSISMRAGWVSYFAYDKVDCIAVTPTKTFAISNGALFSVDRVSEKIQKYDLQSGLHATGLTYMSYDSVGDQLVLVYQSGKIDVMDAQGRVSYISGLYDKDMTADKMVNSITEHDGIAYLSTAFGIVTFDLQKRVLVDTYIIGAEGRMINVADVVFRGDSIYAFSEDNVYSASMRDNVVDYRVWTMRPQSQCAVRPDASKGVLVRDRYGNTWQAGGARGLVRTMRTGEVVTYKPDGPLQNIPYRMTYQGGRLYVVSGGRWASQDGRPGCVMIYDAHKWHNITQSQIVSVTGNPCLDFMNVAVDPQDDKHYFVTSYGTGLYEFRNDVVVRQYLPDNSTLVDASGINPFNYTRCDGAVFDAQQRLWLLNAGTTAGLLKVMQPDGEWQSVSCYINSIYQKLATPSALVMDRQNPNYKYFLCCRGDYLGLYALDDNGTITGDDDQVLCYRELVDQDGRSVSFESAYCLTQMSDGSLWMGTDRGPIIIPQPSTLFRSAGCQRLRIQDGDAYLMDSEKVNDFSEDASGRVWVATASMGVYVLSMDGEQLLEHYTSDNTSMPSNSALSLAWDYDHSYMYIGTSDGLVAWGERLNEGLLEESPAHDADEYSYGSMQQWQLHPSFAAMKQVIVTPSCVYGLSSGALFSVDKESEQIQYHNKLNGLNGSTISRISYNAHTDQLLIVYQDGMIDLLSQKGVVCMLDLYQKASSMSITVQDIHMRGKYAYLAMPFGIVVLNMMKHEVADTYYIGAEASSVDVRFVTTTADSIYAFSATDVYRASLSDNLVNFAVWHSMPLDGVTSVAATEGEVYVQREQSLYRLLAESVQPILSDLKFIWTKNAGRRWLARVETYGDILINPDLSWRVIQSEYASADLDYDAQTGHYWQANARLGLVRLSDYQRFQPDGPLTNDAFELTFVDDVLYVAPGGRWADSWFRTGGVSIYRDGVWSGVPQNLLSSCAGLTYYDVVSVAGRASQPDDVYIASYGGGVIHLLNGVPTEHFSEGKNGCTLTSAAEGEYRQYYVRVDGLYMDAEGYLWMLNTSEQAKTINVKSPSGQWFAYNIYSNGLRVHMTTPGNIVSDCRDARYKWMYEQRDAPGVIFHFDNGTPMNGHDDRAIKRNTFFDQQGNAVVFDYIYSLTQDRSGNVWVGTDAGLFIIPSSVDFFTSNQCHRVIITRDDGTNLADYLLGTERINCILVDGGNRKWIGTESSGLYLVSEDGLEILAHFMAENSPLPSNEVQSLAIHPVTGDLFVGTSRGIASYRSGSSEPRPDFDGVYAYPNPVRPDYRGDIAITGLMENTEVFIVDAGGHLVCKTRSQGGTAVWNGCLSSGRRAASGVYTVLCNTADGKNHAVTKILIMN